MKWSRSGASCTGGGIAGGGAGGTDVDDLIHLRGPLTEDALVRALQARFYHNKFYVSYVTYDYFFCSLFFRYIFYCLVKTNSHSTSYNKLKEKQISNSNCNVIIKLLIIAILFYYCFKKTV